MYLSKPSPLPFKDPSPSGTAAAAASSALFRSFELSLRRRLLSLVPESPAPTLPYLSTVASALAATHTDAAALLSDPSLPPSDSAALSSYLNSSVPLLDLCNALSALLDSLLRRRLHLLLALHLLSSRNLSKARLSISDWHREEEKSSKIRSCLKTLPGAAELKRKPPPSAIGRVIYAAEAVTSLAAWIIVSSLWELSAETSVPPLGPLEEFLWVEAYEQVRKAVSGGFCNREVAEVDAVRSSVAKLAAAVDGKGSEEGVRNAAAEVEKRTEELTEGLEKASYAVNGLFRAVMGGRDRALDCFRVGAHKCK